MLLAGRDGSTCCDIALSYLSEMTDIDIIGLSLVSVRLKGS